MKTKHLVAVIVALLLVFCLVVGLMPNFVESKSLYDVYTYKSQILDKNAITEVKIEIDADEFQDMLDNPTDEEEKEANVVINGYKVDNVSIRTKGNSSLTNVASDSTSDRYSFKIDFEAYNDQNLLGLTKLNLNNCYSDPSYMREYVSYCLMEEMGLPTPAFAFTRIYINGELWGLYLGVEQVNSTFINANFSDEDGDLYKLDGTSLRLEDGETAAEYVEENKEGLGLKTNKKSSDYSSIENLIEVINNGGDLESVMDVDEVIRYFAANTALVNVDSYITSMFHNIYLYEEDGVFSIIPWDFDLSMGVFSTDMGGGGGGGGGPGGDGEGGGPGGDETFSPPDALSESTTDTSESESTTSQNMMPTASPTENSTTEDTSDSTDTAPADTSSDTTSTTDSPEMNGQNGGGFGGGGPGGNRGGQGGMGDDENEGGGGGGGMGSQTIKLTDDMIDFPIDTPVSGYDLPSYPLINAWIQNDEYKELYHEYLKEIAEGFMSASRIKTLVAETMNMISTDVANDPNSNFTTEEFQSECESIISFCTQRSASILGQLDGTIDSTKESTGTVTARGAGGGGGMGDGEMPTDMENMPDFDGEMAAPGENTTDESTSSETSSDTENSDNTVSSDTTDETTENTTERTQMDFPGGGGQGGGDGNAMGGGGMGGGGPGGATTQTTTYTSGNLAAYLVSGIVLIVAVLFILFFKRRGRKKFIS